MFDKNAISKENLYYANLKREKRIKDQLDEMEREKKAMDKLKYQIEQDKLYQIEKKNRIKQNQYEDYNNYLRQKYSTPPQYREKLNIKLGGEDRNIKKPSYNEEMDNLCINPTREKNIPTTPAINYSEMGRNYQKGYSHGYNIITGEVYSHQYNNPIPNNHNINNNIEQSEKINNLNNNTNINNNEIPKNNNYNINPEEYEEFLRYKEMKRQKELEEIDKEKYNNYINNNNNINDRNNPQYENAPNYKRNERDERELNYDNRQYRNDIPPPEYQKEPLQFYKDKMNEKNEMNNQYYQEKYNNNLNNNIKDNFHYDKDNLNPNFQKNISDREGIENMYKQNLYKQNKFYEDYEKRFIQNQNQNEQRVNEFYNQNNYPRENEPIPQNDYNNYNESNDIRKMQQLNIDRNMDNYEYQKQMERRENENIPLEYQRRENNNTNIPLEYQRNINLERREQENMPYPGGQYQQGENIRSPNYEKEMMLLRQKYNNNISDNINNDNEEIQFRNNISLQNNPPMMQNNQKEEVTIEDTYNMENNNNINNMKDIEREKYMQYLKNKDQMNEKDLERERYMQYLMSKTNENKEQNEPGVNNNNTNYPPQEPNIPPNSEYYRNREKEYYDNYQKEPIQYNNYIADNINQLQRQRELEERNYQEEQEQPKYLSYQEQMERIKRQEQFFEQEKLKEQNKNINISPNDKDENDTKNKTIKEIISQYNENKRKNLNSEDHIFHVKQVPPTPPKYSDEPLSSKEKKDIQREYAKYLDWQINEKNARNAKTPFYQKYNPILDSDNSDARQYGEKPNPYQQMREKNNQKGDIPVNPYSKYNN